MSEFIETVKMISIFAFYMLLFCVVFVFSALAVLMPIFVYKMKKQINKIEELIENIKDNQELIITILTHMSKEMKDKKDI